MKIKIKRVDSNAIIPTYAHSGDAGFDFYTSENVTVESLSTELIKTGVAIEVPEGYSLEIYPRSGLSAVHPGYLANSVGLVDHGFKNEIVIIFRNNSFNTSVNIPAYTRIAQGVIRKFDVAEFEEVDELSDSERGMNGLGSSGTK